MKKNPKKVSKVYCFKDIVWAMGNALKHLNILYVYQCLRFKKLILFEEMHIHLQRVVFWNITSKLNFLNAK